MVITPARDDNESVLDHEEEPRTPANVHVSFSPEVNAFLNSPAIAALRQEERALSLKLAEQVADDSTDIAEPLCAASKTDVTITNCEALVNDEGDPPLWEMFSGIPNAHDVLTYKAEVLCKFVLMALDDGKFAALTVGNQILLASQPDVLVSSLEITIFLLYIVTKFTSKWLSKRNQNILITKVEALVGKELAKLGYNPRVFSELVHKRYNEYKNYKRWSIEVTEEGRPLFGISVEGWQIFSVLAKIICSTCCLRGYC